MVIQVVRLALACFLVAASVSAGEINSPLQSVSASESGEWRYVDDASQHLVAVRAEFSKPEALIERVKYNGSSQEYYDIVYGVPGSGRVAIVLDRRPNREYQLFVDRNRDRSINGDEQVGEIGREWSTSIGCAISDDDPNDVLERKLRIRRGRLSLNIGTIGYLAGQLTLGDKVVDVKRFDGNADGLFSSPRDAVWLDLDRDGAFDLVDERFPYRPVLPVGDKRWILRSSVTGSKLVAEELAGAGALQVTLTGISESADVKNIEAMFVGEDGAAIGLSSLKGGESVPVGRYAVESATLVLIEEDKQWHFTFSRRGDRAWHEVHDDRTTIVDLLQGLRFAVAHKEGELSPGDSLAVQPQLTTTDGLTLVACSFRDSTRRVFGLQPSHCASLFLQRIGSDAQSLSLFESGFR